MTVAEMSRQLTILHSASPIIARLSPKGQDYGRGDRLWLEDFMRNGLAAIQAMALKYQELATTARDPKEREKLQRYAALYREIAAQTSAPSETAIEERPASSGL